MADESKVSVVGCGQIGMATVFSLLTQNVTNNVALVDVNETKMIGEMMDLQHGSSFMRNAKVQASKDYEVTADSKICIVTAGAAQRVGETRLDLVQRNTDVLKLIIPQLVKYSPDTVVLIATNPVDILTYVTWKLSGLPKQRIIGSGTNLDTSRFQYLLSETLDIAPTHCHGYIIGEHGDSSVPVWSGVNIAGVRLYDLNPKIGEKDDEENWKKIHEKVVTSAYQIIKLKGYTSWAIGLSLSQLAHAILSNVKSVHAVSTYLKGLHGIQDEVFLSLPCVLGNNGVTDVVKQSLSESETKELHKSVALIAKVQKGIEFSSESKASRQVADDEWGKRKEDVMPTVKKLLMYAQPKSVEESSKVTVVGCGNIGMAAVLALLTQNVTNHIAMVDVLEDKMKGEMMDLQHGSSFMRNADVKGSKDYAVSAGSKICIVAAGARQKEGETRLDLVQRNTDVLKHIIPQLVKHSPDTVLMIATDPPVDILTYVAWKLSGLPKHRVIGSGTNLDSARFRYLLSETIGIAATSCYGYIIGEHGDHGIPVWSGVNVAGVRLYDLNPKIGDEGDGEKWGHLHVRVVNRAYKINKYKGYTCWAIGLSLSELANAILSNASSVHPVSTYLKGLHGIEEEVFLSLPCVLGYNGITDVIKQPLIEKEVKLLRKSAANVAKVQRDIKF